MTDARFSVSRTAQRAYKVVGGTRPAGAHNAAREALSKAQATRKPAAIHITHRKDGWAVKTEGRERAASVEPTKSKAVQEGRKTAADRGSRLIEHGQDGRIMKNTKPATPKPSIKPKLK